MYKPDYFHVSGHLSGNGPVSPTRNLTTVGALPSDYTGMEQEPHWDWQVLIKTASVRSMRLEQWFSECVQWGDEALQNAVEIDPKRRGGIPQPSGSALPQSARDL